MITREQRADMRRQIAESPYCLDSLAYRIPALLDALDALDHPVAVVDGPTALLAARKELDALRLRVADQGEILSRCVEAEEYERLGKELDALRLEVGCLRSCESGLRLRERAEKDTLRAEVARLRELVAHIRAEAAP